MLSGIAGKKLGMTAVFAEDGERVAVTAISIEPAQVVQIKTEANDGYNSVQIGFGPAVKKKNINRAQAGHFKDNRVTRHLKEFKVEQSDSFTVGQTIDLSMLAEGDIIDVSANSKGRGFQGVIKRHGFKGGPASHGSRFHRTTGSIGNSADPGRVFPGKKMPGRMGGKRVTLRNLSIYRILADKNVILIKGAVPGHRNGWVEVRKSLQNG